MKETQMKRIDLTVLCIRLWQRMAPKVKKFNMT